MSGIYSSGEISANPAESADLDTGHYRPFDRQHRIKRRRQKIDARVLKQSYALEPGQDEGSEPREQGMGQLLLAQSAASMRHLQESLHAERDAVQNSCHQRELERRSAKLILQEELRMMSLAASEAGHLMAASIGVQWTAFLDMGVAQDLFAAMGQQQEACTQALSLKASLSAAMKDGLAFKDAHYIEMLRAHARELDAYLFQVKTQMEALSEKQDKQSRQVSSALSGERSRVFRECRTRLEAQLEQRAAAEQAFLDKYLVAGNQYLHDLNNASYRAAADAHEQLRERRRPQSQALASYPVLARIMLTQLQSPVRLDGGVQQQEVRLSSLCRFHQQREHQLVYTSRMLHERTDERTAVLEKQKRQIAMLHDALHTLKQKHAQAERGHAAFDEELTRGYIHNLEVHASQQERVGHHSKNEQDKYLKVLELRSHDIERLLVRLASLQNLLGCSTQSGM